MKYSKELQQKILELLFNTSFINVRTICQNFSDINPNEVNANLYYLADEGFVVEVQYEQSSVDRLVGGVSASSLWRIHSSGVKLMQKSDLINQP